MVVWFFCRLALWSLVVGCSGVGPLLIRCLGRLVLWSIAHWSVGPLVLWSFGPLSLCPLVGFGPLFLWWLGGLLFGRLVVNHAVV